METERTVGEAATEVAELFVTLLEALALLEQELDRHDDGEDVNLGRAVRTVVTVSRQMRTAGVAKGLLCEGHDASGYPKLVTGEILDELADLPRSPAGSAA